MTPQIPGLPPLPTGKGRSAEQGEEKPETSLNLLCDLEALPQPQFPHLKPRWLGSAMSSSCGLVPETLGWTSLELPCAHVCTQTSAQWLPRWGFWGKGSFSAVLTGPLGAVFHSTADPGDALHPPHTHTEVRGWAAQLVNRPGAVF